MGSESAMRFAPFEKTGWSLTVPMVVPVKVTPAPADVFVNAHCTRGEEQANGAGANRKVATCSRRPA
jgi:hypothetical protein